MSISLLQTDAEYARLSLALGVNSGNLGGLAGIGECKEMQRKQKLLGARSQQQRKGRVSRAKISDRASLNEDVDDDPQFSPEWIRELKRRVKDSRDPVRYILVSEFTRKFILYYDIASDTFVMNDASRGTLFKRREIAESVKTHLGKSVALLSSQSRVTGSNGSRPFGACRFVVGVPAESAVAPDTHTRRADEPSGPGHTRRKGLSLAGWLITSSPNILIRKCCVNVPI